MNYQTFALHMLILLFLTGCANSRKDKELNDTTENMQVKDSIHYKLPVLDTLKTIYPIQIGNDDALVTVHEIRRNQPDHFIIELDYRNKKAFSVYADKQALIDGTKRPFFLDSLRMDYTEGATLNSVKYKAIRGSTLYFSAVLENEEAQKTVEGRFNVFYDPARSGQFYGWITDTVYNHHSITK